MKNKKGRWNQILSVQKMKIKMKKAKECLYNMEDMSHKVHEDNEHGHSTRNQCLLKHGLFSSQKPLIAHNCLDKGRIRESLPTPCWNIDYLILFSIYRRCEMEGTAITSQPEDADLFTPGTLSCSLSSPFPFVLDS